MSVRFEVALTLVYFTAVHALEFILLQPKALSVRNLIVRNLIGSDIASSELS